MQWIEGLASITRAGVGWILFVALIVGTTTSPAGAQTAAFSEKLLVHANSAATWSSGNANIIQLQGPVDITLDGVKCYADRAVIWLTPAPNGLLAEQQADIILVGNANLEATDNHLTRSGGTLAVNTIVRGAIELTVASRISEDMSQSPLYLQADAVREARDSDVPSSPHGYVGPAAPISSVATTPGAVPGGTSAAGVIQPPPAGGSRITFHASLIQQLRAADGSPIMVLSGGVTITQNSSNGDFLELLSKDAVLFGNDTGSADSLSSRGGTTRPTNVTGHLFSPTSAYLEGDVRVDFIPGKAKDPEQRLTADRVYFDFKTQRAILTSVILHSIDPQSQTPITVRARVMQRISNSEFAIQNGQFTTSKFAVPTYSIGTSYAYVHQEPQDEEYYNITSRDDTLHVLGIPLFYWPALGGTIDTKPFPLRNFSSGNSSRYGFTVNSEWGLFETLDQKPPTGLDVSYLLDYYSDRGVGGGFQGTYKGGFITDSADPWDFQGDFKSYIMSDKGIDQLGGLRTDVDPPTELRGRFLWEHEHFFPDDWQVQVRVGYVSDPTFLEEYYQPEFDSGLPYDAEFYIKRQRDTEVISFLAETDTTDFVTNADRQQEQFDVARLPEISYQRIGDSVVDDQMTLFSNSSAAGLKFDRSNFSLAEQGFYPGLSPGLPSDGQTGTTGAVVFRGDTRDEVDWPISLGEFKFVPYVTGRVTAYSASPQDAGLTRLYGVTGARLTTSFWRVDDSVDSDLLDLHRIRQVIQPEVNVFTTGTTVDESRLYIFDPNVDEINDITGAEVAIHQHWETMRGGPGRWQSVDILDFNVEGDFYPHQPPAAFLDPMSFRGLFFPSEPETSIPRQAINGDVTWHIGDDTAFISDVQWNLDKRELAIAEGGFAINRGSRLSYYVGDAYIQALNSQVFSFNATYNLTSKYTININQAFDFGQSNAAVTYLAVTRRFDTFAVSVSVYHDDINKVSGFNVNLFPAGQPGFSTPWRAND